MGYSILPADRYKVISKTILSEIDKENLIYFYQPIVGSLAISLYLILWQDLDNLESDVYLHHHLMNILKCNSLSLKEARESLEATGLVRSYVKEDNVLEYIYELYSPLSASDFLNHPILNVVLYNNLGSEEFLALVKKHEKKKFNIEGYEEVTKKMDEVFKVETMNITAECNKKTTGQIKLTSTIDYDLIINSIPKNTLSEKAFNKKTKELIDNISFIYNVDTLKMIEFIRKSLNEFGMIDKTVLRQTAQKNYSLSSGTLPTIVYRTQPEYLKKASGDNSIHGRIVAMFENLSPYDFLKSKNKGASPTSKDLKLVESLLLDLELTPAVVNVLLDYCLRKNNNKLVTNYVETVAAQWKRADLKTAEAAMKFAEKEHKKGLKKTGVKEKEKNATPTWFDEEIKKENTTDEERQELEDLLKEFK